jgi:hypothetical protein
MLYLLDFIKQNSDWEQKLSKKPYCITIKRKDNFIMFNYSQIDSDFYNPLVRECRGIILDDKFNPVCVPFFKFGNYGEGYVDSIDWDSARVQEKIDGSLIKVWNYNGEWHVSTNGTIDAKDAEISNDLSPYETFYDLFVAAAQNSNLNINNLDINYTWMFELISPYNRVVVPYTVTELRHIGTRYNETLKECDIDIGVKKPKTYGFKSLEECISMACNLPFSEEGYVVVDSNWCRNKIKSPAYVAAHHLKNNGIVTKSRIVALIRQGEQEEFLNYYPEFKEHIENVLDKMMEFCSDMNWCMETATIDMKFENRKRFAEFATTTRCPAMMFNWFDNKCESAEKWLWDQTDDKIVQWIGA